MLVNLRVLRDSAGISQKQLADAIGVSQQSINKYENHNIEPDIGTLICLADYFETSVDYLIGHSAVRHKVETVTSYDLNEEESYIINNYRTLSRSQRNCIRTVIESYQF